MNTSINVEDAKKILEKHITTPFIMDHSIEAGVIMRDLAKHLGENEVLWEVVGILHDLDMDIIKGDYINHGEKTVEILKEEGIDDNLIFEPILSHTECLEEMNKKYVRKNKIDFALGAAEQITGIITAYARMRPEKFEGMKVKSLTKKFKDKAFAANVNRDFISDIEKIGIDRNTFFEIAIKSLQSISNQISF